MCFLVGLPLYLAVLCLNMHDLRLGTSMAPYLSTSDSEGPSMLSMLIPILVSASHLLKNLEHLVVIVILIPAINLITGGTSHVLNWKIA